MAIRRRSNGAARTTETPPAPASVATRDSNALPIDAVYLLAGVLWCRDRDERMTFLNGGRAAVVARWGGGTGRRVRVARLVTYYK